MKITKKGKSTKNSIIDASKRSFLKYGYDDNTLSDICKRSDTNLGTLTYYFPKKTDLVVEIYSEYTDKILALIDKEAPDVTPRYKYALFVMIYYYQIYSHEQIRRFHYECLKDFSMNGIYTNNRTKSAPHIFAPNDPNAELYIYADNAIRREFNLDFCRNGDFSFEAIKTLLKNIHIVNSRLYTISVDEIEQALEFAAEFMSKHLDCDIELL